MNEYINLLRPLIIKQTEMPNRIFVSAHSYGYADSNGLPDEALFHYIVERAKGGVGLLIMGATSINRVGWLGNGYTLNENDQIVPAYEKISKAVHAHGTKIFDQLFHTGGQLAYGDGNRVYAPSAVSHPRTISLPVELSIEQIQQTIQDYVNAAKRASIGNLDGVEISGAQGFLINEFLSPKHNRRQDKYGGDSDRRMRFLLEVMERIKENVPSNFVVGYRLMADSLEDGDLSLEDAYEVVNTLEKKQLIDYISVIASLNGSYIGYWIGHGDMSVPSMTFADLSSAIRKQTSLPVLLASKVKHPAQAEYLIQQGIADMVAMTRAHIADPEIINKIKADTVDDIRPCISCNQGCVGGSWAGTGVKCIFNPATGREIMLGIGTLIQSPTRKKVVIIGGGAAGMEFARVAAMRGHCIVLYEQRESLGGQLLLASLPPHRHEIEEAVAYLALQIKKLGVEIHLGTKVSADMLYKLEADVVVLATGAVDRIPLIPSGDSSRITTGWKVLDGTAVVGQNVLIVDGDWKQHALSIAEYLVDQGKNVEIITSRFYVGEGLNITNIVSFSSRLITKGAKLTPLLDVISISEKQVMLRHSLTGETVIRNNVDNVVFVAGLKPNNELINQVKGRLSNVIVIGDCDYPRGLQNAIYDAHVKARII